MIETYKQRRWWFATHPEYSDHKGGQKQHGHKDKEGQEKVAPKAVDAYVDEALKYLKGPEAAILKSVKKHFGTDGNSGELDNASNRVLLAGLTVDLPPELEQYVVENQYTILPFPGIIGVRGAAGAGGLIKGSGAAVRAIKNYNASRVLGRNLMNFSKARHSALHDAHHIIPWGHSKADAARRILDKWHIPLHGAENGMWLERPFHRTLSNNHKYMEAITEMLKKAQGKEHVLKILEQIRDSLSKGVIPH